MSCRKGRNGQAKGGSDARLKRERDLGEQVFWRNSKRMRTQPRRLLFAPVEDLSKYKGYYLRRLRALRGVGPAVKLCLAFQ